MIAQSFRLLEKVPIRLGVMSTVGHLRLARFLARFEKMHKGLELSVSEGSITDLNEGLNDGEIDIAIMTRTDPVTVPGRRHSPSVDAFLRTTRSFAWPG